MLYTLNRYIIIYIVHGAAAYKQVSIYSSLHMSCVRVHVTVCAYHVFVCTCVHAFTSVFVHVSMCMCMCVLVSRS